MTTADVERPCVACGYDLRASTGVCPECGLAFSADEPAVAGVPFQHARGSPTRRFVETTRLVLLRPWRLASMPGVVLFGPARRFRLVCCGMAFVAVVFYEVLRALPGNPLRSGIGLGRSGLDGAAMSLLDGRPASAVVSDGLIGVSMLAGMALFLLATTGVPPAVAALRRHNGRQAAATASYAAAPLLLVFSYVVFIHGYTLFDRLLGFRTANQVARCIDAFAWWALLAAALAWPACVLVRRAGWVWGIGATSAQIVLGVGFYVVFVVGLPWATFYGQVLLFHLLLDV